MNATWTDSIIASLREHAADNSIMRHAAERLAALESLLAEKQAECDELRHVNARLVEHNIAVRDSDDPRDALLAEKQRQCDVLTDSLAAIDKLTRNCPCMSLQAQHEFERNAESEAYRVSLNQLILAIREQARL